MKYSRIVQHMSRCIITLLSLALIGTLAIGQDLVTGSTATFSGSGQYNIKGNITNSAPVTINGTVTMDGASAQTIGWGGYAVNFGSLNINTSGGLITTFAVPTTISTALSVANGTTLAIGNNLLIISGASTLNSSGVLSTGASSTVVFNSAGAQEVLGGTTYNGNLTLSNGTKSISSSVTVGQAFSHTGSKLTINSGGSLALGTAGAFAAVDNTGTITGGSGAATFNGLLTQTGGGSLTSGSGNLSMLAGITNTNGNITVGAGRSMSIAGGDFAYTAGTLAFDNTSTVVYNGSATSIAPATYGILTFNTDAKSIAGSTTVNGTLNANSDISVTGTLAFSAAASANISTGFTNNGTFTAPSGAGVVTFNGSAQSIGGSSATTFKNLTFGGTGAITANAGINISSGGLLTVNQPLIMSGSNALTMKDGAQQPTFAGQTEITGSMAWEATSAQTYIFNNASTEIAFTAADAGRTLMLKSQPGVSPTDYSSGHTVNRKFNVIFAGSTATSINVKLAYLQSEGSTLGVTENKLKNFQNGIASVKKVPGIPARVASGAGFGSVTYSNLSNAQLLAINELAMDDQFNAFRSIAGATTWDVTTSWDAGAVPGGTDDVEIAGSYAVTIPGSTAATANSVLIEQGASGGLTLSGTGTLSVGSGGLTNNNSTGAGLNVGSGTIVTVATGTLTNNGAISNSGIIRVQ